MFPISPKLIMPLLLCVGVATSCYLVYRHITLQASTIASLQASEAVLKLSLESATNTANENAQKYITKVADTQKLLEQLKAMQENIDKLKQESINRDKEFNDYVKALPQDSFEAQCYRMPVIKSSSLQDYP